LIIVTAASRSAVPVAGVEEHTDGQTMALLHEQVPGEGGLGLAALPLFGQPGLRGPCWKMGEIAPPLAMKVDLGIAAGSRGGLRRRPRIGLRWPQSWGPAA
jgi:hypothetical protein